MAALLGHEAADPGANSTNAISLSKWPLQIRRTCAASAVYWSPKNLRTRADLRARTRKNGSENTIWEMLPYRS